MTMGRMMTIEIAMTSIFRIQFFWLTYYASLSPQGGFSLADCPFEQHGTVESESTEDEDDDFVMDDEEDEEEADLEDDDDDDLFLNDEDDDLEADESNDSSDDENVDVDESGDE